MVKQRTIKTEEFEWNVWETGSPNSSCVVVCLHGFMGTGEDWVPLMQRLSEHTRCIAVDLPGHGKTRGDLEKNPWKNVMQEMIRLFNALTIPPPVVLGYSMGGRLAIAIAEAMKYQVRGLIVESALPGIDDELERLERYHQDLERALDLTIQDFDQFLQRWYDQPLFASLRQHPEFQQLMEQRFRDNDPLQLAIALKVLSVAHQPSYWQWLGATTLPVLFLAGEKDAKYAAIAQRVAALHNASVRVEIVPGAGHTIHFEAPERFAQLVEQFLSQVCWLRTTREFHK